MLNVLNGLHDKKTWKRKREEKSSLFKGQLLVSSELFKSYVIKKEQITEVENNTEGEESFGVFESLSVGAENRANVVNVKRRAFRGSDIVFWSPYMLVVHV